MSVYLVSSRQVGSEVPASQPYDNRGFTDVKTENATYDSANGVSIPADKQRATKPYRGMGKEDLLRFSSTPFWWRLRMACMAFVILAWVALICTVVGLVLAYPKCRDAGTRSWWQSEVMYRIYVPSFKDSDDDGVGDLKGIETKLDYLHDQGIGIVSLSPVYPTSDTDFATGNDAAITNHTSVHVRYGDMADFDSLVEAVHKKGMFLVMDFLPSQTSEDHLWFVESSNSSARTNAKRNFYLWEDSTTPPNNWNTTGNGPAWTLTNGSRNQVYYHHRQPDTPDLNIRSAQVQQELEDILTFWLDHGVDGFNVRDATFLFEDFDLRDEPLKNGSTSDDYASYNHIYTTNQPEVYSMLTRWRQVLRDHSESEDKLLITGINDLDVSHLYGDCAVSGVQMPLNDGFTDIRGDCDAGCIARYLDSWIQATPTGDWFNWVVGDDTSTRFASRFNSTYANSIYTLTMLLPGTPVLYYGDEVSMVDQSTSSALPWQRNQAMRTIMQWENGTDAGFSDCINTTCPQPWTAVNDDYQTENVMTQSKTAGSLLNILKDVATLRQEPSFRVGEYSPAVRDNDIFSFVREFDGETGYLVAINFGPDSQTRDYTGSHDTIQEEVVVSFVYGSGYAVDDEVETTDITLGPYGGIVLSWDYMAKEL